MNVNQFHGVEGRRTFKFCFFPKAHGFYLKNSFFRINVTNDEEVAVKLESQKLGIPRCCTRANFKILHGGIDIPHIKVYQ